MAAADASHDEGGRSEGGEQAEQARIAIFLRLRPVPRPTPRITCSTEDNWVEFQVPRDATQG